MLKKRKKLKVLKARGGMDASKADFGVSAPSPGATGGEGGFGKSTQQFGGTRSSPTSTGGRNQPVRSTTSPKIAQSNFFSGFTNALDSGLGIPVTPAGLAITSLKAIENARRAKRAKGEYFTSSKKIMPANRDFYRQYGRKLDTKIGSADEDYLKEAGISGFGIPKNPEEGMGTPKTVICPDGSMPPCEDTTKSVSVPNTKTEPYPIKLNFNKGGLSGGVRSGPPPKRGPNPQGLKNGGMTCPHRPDGIRGYGAAIKGFKFTGVK